MDWFLVVILNCRDIHRLIWKKSGNNTNHFCLCQNSGLVSRMEKRSAGSAAAREGKKNQKSSWPGCQRSVSPLLHLLHIDRLFIPCLALFLVCVSLRNGWLELFLNENKVGWCSVYADVEMEEVLPLVARCNYCNNNTWKANIVKRLLNQTSKLKNSFLLDVQFVLR